MALFEQRLLAEGIRAIEGDAPALSASLSTTPSNNSFEQRLLRRALALDPQLGISVTFGHFKRLTKNLFSLSALLLFIIGAGSVQQLFFSEQGTQINFFWAFALFLLPNMLTLFFWLLLFLRPNLLDRGWLARFSFFLLKKVEKHFNSQATQAPHFWALFRCYFKLRFSGFLGRYQLSALTHLLWLSYFTGAILMLIVMLATHQVDFIWQTSILSLADFQWLTALLAYIPEQLGIQVPDAMQIQGSNLAITNGLADAQQSRFVWSGLLISSLFIYGLIPRLLLCSAMLFLLKIKKKAFRLNLTHPYYVQLRQQLKPNVTSLGVSDPDTVKVTSVGIQDTAKSEQQLPAVFYPIALELSDAQFSVCRQHVERYSSQYSDALNNICDFAAQQALLDCIADIHMQHIVLYVSLSRLPDRGVLRFINGLTEQAKHSFYLLLIDDRLSEPAQLNKRRNEWYKLAAQTTIPLDNIIGLQPHRPTEEK